MGEWQHVPNVVTVLHKGHERRATVKSHQQWSILEGEHSKVKWQVMIVLPREVAPYPLIFPAHREARDWARDRDEIRDFDPSAAERAERASRGSGTHHSLTFYPDYNGGGIGYTVPPGTGVDWASRQPSAAGVPEWMPLSFETSGRSDLYGHEFAEGQQYVCLVGTHMFNLPFPLLESASTD
jgi:hypothetical protein